MLKFLKRKKGDGGDNQQSLKKRSSFYFFWSILPLIGCLSISYVVFISFVQGQQTTTDSSATHKSTDFQTRWDYNNQTTNTLKFLDFGENRDFPHNSLIEWRDQLTSEINKAKSLHSRYNTVQFRNTESFRENLGWLYLTQRRINVYGNRLDDVNQILEYQDRISNRNLSADQKNEIWGDILLENFNKNVRDMK